MTAQGEKGIQQAIMAGGPVETAFSVYDDFEDYVSTPNRVLLVPH